MNANPIPRTSIARAFFPLSREGVLQAEEFVLIDSGCACQAKGMCAQAQELYNQANKIAQKHSTPDAQHVCAEALVRLGDMAFFAEPPDYAGAGQYYETASLYYHLLSRHNFGAVLSRQAMLLEVNGKRAEALELCQQLYVLWHGLAKEQGRRGNHQKHARYTKQCQYIWRRIETLMGIAHLGAPDAVRDRDVVASPLAAAGNADTVSDGQDSVTDQTDAKTLPGGGGDAPRVSKFRSGKVIRFPVYADIAAGRNKLAPGIHTEEAYFQVTELEVGGVRYRIEPVSENVDPIYVRAGESTGISRVFGNSMNKANIEEGDYVVYVYKGASEYPAFSNDIVVATYEAGGQTENVVKRFKIEDGIAMLWSESTDSYDPIPALEKNVHLVGKVVAVLKQNSE